MASSYVPVTGSVPPVETAASPPAFSGAVIASPGGTPASPPPSSPPSGFWAFLSVPFYQPYFNVDTADVAERLKGALLPWPGSLFLEKTAENPDLYGPFWICSTLVFVSSALGNLSGYLASAASASPTAAKWHYNIDAVSWAAFIFYGYCAVVPLALFFVLRYFQIYAGLIQLWCLYGYSLTVFIPITFVSVIPLEILKWVVVMSGTALSVTFLSVNLRAHISQGHAMWLPVVAAAAALQAGLGLFLKLYFFR